jgi:hypothetical protein
VKTILPKLYLLLFILIFVTLACGVNVPGFQTQATPVVLPVTSPTPALPLRLTPASIDDGLALWQSYRANLILDFEGVRGDQPLQGRVESLTEVTRQPAALHRYLKVETTLSQPGLIPGSAEFYRMGDKVYVKKGAEDRWLTFKDSDVSPEALGFFKLEDLIILPPLLSQPPQLEFLDGLEVQHYPFTAADLSTPNLIFAETQGDLWLVPPDNYLVQYVISTTLRVAIPDPRVHIFDQGHLKLHYTLTDINANFDIIPPQSILTRSNALGSLPRLPDAQIISVFPTFIEYTSATTPVSATLFYQEQLTTQGWTENTLTVFTEKARLSYFKEDQALTVLINPAEDNKIKVLLDLK